MKALNMKRATGTLMTIATLIFGTASVSAYVFERVQDDEGNWRQCDDANNYGVNAPNLHVLFDRSKSMLLPSGIGGNGPDTYEVNADVTSEGQTDAGLVFVDKNDPENPTGQDALSLSNKIEIPPYLWVANHSNNTLSKFNTNTFLEEGRYAVGSNPSRTAVDLDSNAWVGTRGDGLLSKVLALREACYDRNGNGVIDTSIGTNVLPYGRDECVAYQGRLRNATIRGLAAGPDGKMWIGYSSGGGGVQSIDVATFQAGAFVSDGSIPRWDKNGSGTFYNTNRNLAACNVYGLVLDRNGLLYASDTCRNRLPAYDTRAKRWKAIYYTGSDRCLYGITTDSKNRIWNGCWPGGSGTRVFDPATLRMTHFPHARGKVTGVAVEPETGDVWISFYATGYTGRLRVNESNLPASRWTIIPTTKWTPGPGGNLPRYGTNTRYRIGNDLRGIGFDKKGFAWTLGLNSSKVFKIDPSTNQRSADLPLGLDVGVGSHYTYSDFTGSTAQAFTAPSGRWRHIYPVGVPAQFIKSVNVKAHAPAQTTVGVRFRALDRNGNAITGWYPPEINGSAKFFPYRTNATSIAFPVPQGNDNPFIAEQLEVDVKLATNVTGIRPFLFDVSFDTNDSKPALVAAQDIVAGLNNASSIPGQCTETDATKCDFLRIGMSYFDATYQEVTVATEDTANTINQSVATTTADGLTNLATVARQVRDMPSLKDTKRDNYVLLVSDGRLNKVSELQSSVASLCQANTRASAPVQTYTMSLGPSSDFNANSLLAAAGGTGQCCLGSARTCAPAQQIDVCNPAKLAPFLRQVGQAPYTFAEVSGITCSGTLTALDITTFKTTLLDRAKEESSRFDVNIINDPQMYNKPTYPQKGLLPDPNATKIEMIHTLWNKVELPYCDPATMSDCGLDAELRRNNVNATIAAGFKNEGWYFEDPNKRDVVKITPRLADEVAGRRVKTTTIQAACQCFKPEGSPCDVPGYNSGSLVGSRCSVGTYACNAQAFDTCVPQFRAMPEVCNGKDDDCNGFEDDLVDKKKSTKYGPGIKWSSVANNDKPDGFDDKRELVCNFENICVCDIETTSQNKDKHLGEGGSFKEELNDYFQKTFDGKRDCLCGEGLQPEDIKPLTGPIDQSNNNSAANEPQAAGCSSTENGATSSLLAFGFFALFFFRRRKKKIA